MKTKKYLGINCVSLKNECLSLLVTQSVGPRIISMRFNESANLLATLPEQAITLPDRRVFHFYGGHRLWIAPEIMPLTYEPDDKHVDIQSVSDGIVATQPVDEETGIQKSMKITLTPGKHQVTIRHTLANHGMQSVVCAAWAITQFKPGGMAVLPQSQQETGFSPNRSLVVWPYTDLTSPSIQWGNRYILISANMQKAFKLGFPNPRGWLAYWMEGILFVKKAIFNSDAEYCYFNSSSQCYLNNQFLELETMSPLVTLNPDSSVSHTEIWELYPDIPPLTNEFDIQEIINQIGLT